MEFKISSKNQDKIAQEILNSFKPILFSGENEGFNFLIYKSIKENLQIKNFISIDEAYLLQNRNEFILQLTLEDFFSEKKIIKINSISDKSFFILSSIVEKIKIQKDIFLILFADEKTDEKSKIYKLFQERENLFLINTDNFDIKYFKNRLQIEFSSESWFNQEIESYLLETINKDVFSFENEIEKIKLYLLNNNDKIIDINFFKDILEDFSIHSVFELIHSICLKDNRNIFYVINNLENKNEFNLVGFLHLSFAHFYDMLIYKKNHSLLMQPYLAYKFKEYINNWDVSELIRIIQLFQDLEKDNLKFGEKLTISKLKHTLFFNK